MLVVYYLKSFAEIKTATNLLELLHIAYYIQTLYYISTCKYYCTCIGVFGITIK